MTGTGPQLDLCCSVKEPQQEQKPNQNTWSVQNVGKLCELLLHLPYQDKQWETSNKGPSYASKLNEATWTIPRTTLPFQRIKAKKATNTMRKGLKETKSSHFICHNAKKMTLTSSSKPATQLPVTES